MIKQTLLLLLASAAMSNVLAEESVTQDAMVRYQLELRQGGKVLPAYDFLTPYGVTSRFEKDIVSCADLLTADTIRSSYVASCDSVGFSGAVTAADYDSKSSTVRTLLRLKMTGLRLSDNLTDKRGSMYVVNLKSATPYLIAEGEHGVELTIKVTIPEMRPELKSDSKLEQKTDPKPEQTGILVNDPPPALE